MLWRIGLIAFLTAVLAFPSYAQAQEARNGEMVAIWLLGEDETTLKYFYLENGRVRLQPANPQMDPIFVEDPSTVEIKGKVVMVIRQVDQQVA